MSSISMKDGTHIYYKDWGTGTPVVFSHGWPLSSDSWEAQMLFLASNGYRAALPMTGAAMAAPASPGAATRWTPMPTTSRSLSKSLI